MAMASPRHVMILTTVMIVALQPVVVASTPLPLPPLGPNFMPCLKGSPGIGMPFCDHTLPVNQRVQDLIGRMTQAEKCSQLDDKMGPVNGTGFSGYNWNTECLHGLGAQCHTVNNVTRCPTVFAAPPGLGSTFNTTVAHELGRIISDEIRAYTNTNGRRGFQNRSIGVSAWGPNLNIYRDPRWGRNVEVPSEDPYHSGSYGVAYTKGLQWGSDSKYTKAIGALKHYTIYSDEATRGRSYFEISAHDIEDTYLPQFKAPVVEAGSLGYMCSYAALTNAELIPNSEEPSHPHSEPCCASKFFAQTKMVQEFGFKGYVQSDCGAVNNMVEKEHWAANATDAAAKSMTNGMMNSNCGGGLVLHACEAVASGLATQADLEARITRSLTLLMNAGLFDPIELQPYSQIPFETINSEASQAASLDAARQSFVLLQNPASSIPNTNVLPLSKNTKIALIGPHILSQQDLAGNYFEQIGLGTCAGPQCIPTIRDAIGNVTAVENLRWVEACADMKCASANFSAAIELSQWADTIVLAMGISGEIEGEGHDRMDIRLPGLQYNLTKAIIETNPGKPIVLLLFNGGMVTIEDLKDERIAVVECWYPGATGGTSVAEMLFGDTNRFGKLPFTYYAYNYTLLSDFSDMNMTASQTNPGRSYKYLEDESLALWPFGFGLSYTEFELTSDSALSSSGGATYIQPRSVLLPPPLSSRSSTSSTISARGSVDATWFTTSITVKNIGDREGDEVVFLFHNGSVAANLFEPSDPLAKKILIAYDRVTLCAGCSKEIVFNITVDKMTTVDKYGTRHVLSGEHALVYSRGHGETFIQIINVIGRDNDIANTNTIRPPRHVVSTMEGYTHTTGV
eukprot:m.51547 g.51547  ORF g.51547 m.51547 type:complete len:852 (+) comp21462_c0_seq2:24-2579(+)